MPSSSGRNVVAGWEFSLTVQTTRRQSRPAIGCASSVDFQSLNVHDRCVHIASWNRSTSCLRIVLSSFFALARPSLAAAASSSSSDFPAQATP